MLLQYLLFIAEFLKYIYFSPFGVNFIYILVKLITFIDII